MKKSSKIFMIALIAGLIIGIGAVSFAAWSGSGASVANASGSTGQVSLIGGIKVSTPDA